ncbi:hypothetical protein Tco_1310717 [Tanacetum coccineum]
MGLHVEKESQEAKYPFNTSIMCSIHIVKIAIHTSLECHAHCIAQKACDDSQKVRNYGHVECKLVVPSKKGIQMGWQFLSSTSGGGVVFTVLKLPLAARLSPSGSLNKLDHLQGSWDHLPEQETNLLLPFKRKVTVSPKGVESEASLPTLTGHGKLGFVQEERDLFQTE